MGTFVFSFMRGMLMKLPSKVATKITTTIHGLKPTSAKAMLMTPKKIKTATPAKIRKSKMKKE
jgi:hypothetical protein